MIGCRSSQDGITTVELLVAGFIVALVVFAGIPAMMDFSRKQDMLGVHQNLYSALALMYDHIESKSNPTSTEYAETTC